MARWHGFPRKWFCSGCGKDHALTRDIEGTDGPRKFCGASIRRAVKEGRNDRPAYIGREFIAEAIGAGR
jgi:hypothetical protein